MANFKLERPYPVKKIHTKLAYDLEGKRFGKLTVLHLDPEYDPQEHKSGIRWVIECECGHIGKIIASRLLSGKAISCGCAAQSRAINGVVMSVRECRQAIDVAIAQHGLANLDRVVASIPGVSRDAVGRIIHEKVKAIIKKCVAEGMLNPKDICRKYKLRNMQVMRSDSSDLIAKYMLTLVQQGLTVEEIHEKTGVSKAWIYENCGAFVKEARKNRKNSIGDGNEITQHSDVGETA